MQTRRHPIALSYTLLYHLRSSALSGQRHEVSKEIVSLILGDPGAVSWVRKNGGESFQEQVREPLG